jgi:hypothetical protein
LLDLKVDGTRLTESSLKSNAETLQVFFDARVDGTTMTLKFKSPEGTFLTS